MTSQPIQSSRCTAASPARKTHGFAAKPLCRSSFNIHRSSFSHRRAYTLIEVLVVAVIVVLMLGMALPVFRVITGSRSEAGAANIIASMLGRARTDAIGLQQPIGVAFIYNPTSQLSYMAEVEFPPCPTWVSGFNQIAGSCTQVLSSSGLPYYFFSPSTPTSPSVTPSASPSDSGSWQWVCGPPLEIRQNTEAVPLPQGIGVSTICNCNMSGGKRNSNGYLSVGVIMFDGYGRITSTCYGIPKSSRLAVAGGLADGYPSHDSPQAIGEYNYGGTFTQFGVASQYGLVVYQREAYQTQQSSKTVDALYIDATSTSPSTTLPDYVAGNPTQQQQENWLDQNATPLLINRYTGTLIRAE